jgi:hypothetical protein
MSFNSVYAPRIWDDLYTVLIPDILTQNPDYLRKFGVTVTGNKAFDATISTNHTTVKIPIIKILEYFLQGHCIQIPSRQDMINIHKNIENYLQEWRDYLHSSLHAKVDIELNKELIFGLEKLSKYIYSRAHPQELIDESLTAVAKFGLTTALSKLKQQSQTPQSKPNYSSISELLKPNSTRFLSTDNTDTTYKNNRF